MKYSVLQHVGEAMAANAVTNAIRQGLPAPVHWCPMCAMLAPNHAVTCEYQGVYPTNAAAMVAGELRLS
jgi:hypothetical protein